MIFVCVKSVGGVLRTGEVIDSRPPDPGAVRMHQEQHEQLQTRNNAGIVEGDADNEHQRWYRPANHCQCGTFAGDLNNDANRRTADDFDNDSIRREAMHLKAS